MNSTQTRLSALWIFATLNYLYCDVVSLMDSSKLRGFLSGSVGGLDISQQFLLPAAVLVEVPMAMVLVSRLTIGRANRAANIAAGVFMTVVQFATLVATRPTVYYGFFSAIEIAATATIVVVAALGSRSAHQVAAAELEDAA